MTIKTNRQSRIKRRRTLSICVTQSGNPLRHHLLGYAARALSFYELEPMLLALILDILCTVEKELFLSVVSDHWTDEAEKRIKIERLNKMSHKNTEGLVKHIEDALSSDKNSLSAGKASVLLKEAIIRDLQKFPEPASFKKRLRNVKRVFRLTDDDANMLTLALCYDTRSSFENYWDSIAYGECWQIASRLTGKPCNRVRACWSRQGRLRQCQLIDPKNVRHSGALLALHDGISDYLSGNDPAPLQSWCFDIDQSHPLSLSSFGLPPQSLQLVTSLIRSGTPCHILLYGEPGTGKTELAKSLVAECGKRACFVQHGDRGKNNNRCVALEATINMVSAKDSVVVVDESDGLLNTRYAFTMGDGGNMIDKGWLNTFLDRQQGQVIWISNDIRYIEESTRRRFTYSLPFKRQSLRQRESIWETHLKNHPLRAVIAPMTHTLSLDYPVDAGGIANALETARTLGGKVKPDRKTVEATLRNLLSSHQELTGQRRKGNLIPLAEQYDPDVLNMSIEPENLIQSLKAYAGRADGSSQGPMNLLFWGLPGTGKTAFAQHLALVLGRELLIKRASDLLSMWVGGTEERIREAFQEAEREHAVLLLDESDSFFIERQTAFRSWEASQTNELLTQMENHHGILICCTNLRDRLDHAAMRRFAWKVEFLPLTREGRFRLYRKYFETPENPVSAELMPRIAQMTELTPGDIKAVWQQFRYQEPERMRHESVVAALEEELRLKDGDCSQIGFNLKEYQERTP